MLSYNSNEEGRQRLSAVAVVALSGLVLLAAAVWLFNMFEPIAVGQSTLPNAPLFPITVGAQTIEVEIARLPRSRAQGLSGRASLAEGRGMLFIFDEPERPAFWMKAMRFPIDIIWIDQAGKITEITAAVTPESYPQQFIPQQPVRYVLEMSAGWAARKGIAPGVSVNVASISEASADR